jgi:hypothetical protein
MGQAVQRWVADDGTEFDTQKDMIIHEMTILDEKEIDLFLANIETSVKRISEYRKLLITWQKYIRGQSFREPEAAPEQLTLNLAEFSL